MLVVHALKLKEKMEENLQNLRNLANFFADDKELDKDIADKTNINTSVAEALIGACESVREEISKLEEKINKAEIKD